PGRTERGGSRPLRLTCHGQGPSSVGPGFFFRFAWSIPFACIVSSAAYNALLVGDPECVLALLRAFSFFLHRWLSAFPSASGHAIAHSLDRRRPPPAHPASGHPPQTAAGACVLGFRGRPGSA